MIGMQYTIQLPADYDMNIIYDRVRQNGYKTDRYSGLVFKAYLATVKGQPGQLSNSYCPLYVWDHHDGLNSFLFDGPYDAILQSFGWQQVQIGIPLELPRLEDSGLEQACVNETRTLAPAFEPAPKHSAIHDVATDKIRFQQSWTLSSTSTTQIQQTRYVIEYIGSIPRSSSLQQVPEMIIQQLQAQNLESLLALHQGRLLIYNPDQWAYHQFYFMETLPEHVPDCCNVYSILHWSFGAGA